MANPPGVNVTVTAASSSPQTNPATATWFVTGLAAGGPAGVAVPVNSIQDFNTYFGTYTNGGVTGRTSTSATLYDSLDVYFREGGVRTYVSRVLSSSAGAADCVIETDGDTFLTLTAVSGGTWANSDNTSPAGLIVTTNASGNGGYSISVTYNGEKIGATSPTLFTASDAVAWISSLATPGVLFTASAGVSTVVPGATTNYFTGGSDGSSIAESDWTDALDAFNVDLGAGQVSAPGHTTSVGWQKLADHAASFNRVAILDAVDGADVAALTNSTTGSASIQTGGANPAADSSYAAIFGPWVKTPGVASTQPNTIAPVFTRLVPPSAYVAANCAANDLTNDANVSAAGIQNGSSPYALDVTTTYSAADRATLNAAGVNLLRNINGTVATYGFRSLATDSNWVALNNVRFRMQIVNNFNSVGEQFVFAEIDGKGQIFARFAGALSAVCQQYWIRNSLYGATPTQAFGVNVGPQVNTPATIAAGQLNAQVNLRMSPQAEQVSITVTKYLVTAPLPSN